MQFKVDTVLQNETIWLTQEKMAELFGVQRPAITKHLQNIFDSAELDEQVVSSILEHTTAHDTAARDFALLLELGIVEKQGKGRSIHYVLAGR